MTKRTITVTEEDIANGKQGSSDSCPIALAMSRELGTGVHVGFTVANFRNPNGTYTFIQNPKVAQNFIMAFDGYHMETVLPVSFEVEVPDA